MNTAWQVRLSKSAQKQYEKLKRNGTKRPSTCDSIDLLVQDLKLRGPELSDWPNYGKLAENKYHCHLKKGRPTFVACWIVFDKRKKEIEVYYVGTHESAPY